MRLIHYLLLIPFLAFPQGIDTLNLPLIRIGERSVSVGEFLERYELTPQEGKQSKGNKFNKMENFAYTLIAEKLWAKEAEALRLDTTEAMRISSEAFEKMFIRDALYKKMIRDKIEITPEEIKAGMIRNSKKLFVRYLFSEDREEIFNLYELINKGVPFDTILAESPEAEEQISPVEIVFGQLERSVEDSLFNLRLGEHTAPIITPDGWYIFKLVNKQEQAGIFLDPEHDSYKDAEKIIRLRKEQELYAEFFAKFFSKKNVDASFEPIKKLSAAISDVISARINEEKISIVKPYQLDAIDIVLIKEKLGSSNLGYTIVNIEGKIVSVNDFLLEAAFNGLNIKDPGPEAVFRDVNRLMRKFIESELLALEGIKLGLKNDPAVMKDLAVWKENYLYQALESLFRDSVKVSDEEARYEYDRIFKEKLFPAQLNLFRIYSKSAEVADTITRKLNSGIIIENLFREYQALMPAGIRGGESGYFWVNEFGQAGEIASRMEVGEVYGPLKIGDEYLVFKVIGKKSEKTELPEKSFQEVKENIKSEIGFRRLKSKINAYTVSLAVKYGFSLDLKLMGQLDPTGINSFAVRSLGFGGSTPAVPLLAPNYEWFFLYLNTIQKMNP
ncbi:MAG: hypothetical protein HUU54_17155 [Ignavibacteriaceae bacterium]|nr:hypothetical protein [Ignavibacteriaceae bacterium]